MGRSLRILYATRGYTTHDRRFLEAIRDGGHEVGLLRFERQQEAVEEMPLPDGILEPEWAEGPGPARATHAWRQVSDLRRVIREFRPDIVHAGPIQRSALLVALAGFHPLISMSWGYDLIQDAGRNALWGAATRFTLERSALMIGDCQTIEDLAGRYGMRPDRVVWFPWGIDLKQFSPPPDSGGNTASPQEFVLLSTRSWEPIYGIDIIARAFVAATAKLPGLRMVMLGGGSMASEIRDILTRGGVLHQVSFPGQLPQSDLPDLYRSCDLYVAASHSDGTSISLLEALASGRPVAVPDIPGNREWVRQGWNGWLFPDGDALSLASLIIAAAGRHACDPEGWRAISGRALSVAQGRADWRTNQLKLLDAYERVAHGR